MLTIIGLGTTPMLPAQLPATNISSICTVDFEGRHLDICRVAVQSVAIWALLRAQAMCWFHQRLLGHASDYIVKVFALGGRVIQLCLFYIGYDIGEYIGCFIWHNGSTTTEIGPEQSNTAKCARWCFSKSKSFYNTNGKLSLRDNYYY